MKYTTETLRVLIIMLRNTIIFPLTLKHPLRHCNDDQHEHHYEDDTKQSYHNIAIAEESAQVSIIVDFRIGNSPRNGKRLVTILTCAFADGSKRRGLEVKSLGIDVGTQVGEDGIALSSGGLCMSGLDAPSSEGRPNFAVVCG